LATSRSSDVVSPGVWLWVVFGSLCPQDHLELWSEIRLPACARQSELLFHQAAAAVPFSCSSVWSAPPPERWGNSVLKAAPIPEIICGSLFWEVALFCEVGLSPHPCSQPLCFSQSLLGVGSSSRRLACHPAPALSLCCFACVFVHWEFGTETLDPCPTAVLEGRFSVPSLLLTVGVRLQFTVAVYVFQFCCWVWGHSAQGLH
jgi:hypothetical protein